MIATPEYMLNEQWYLCMQSIEKNRVNKNNNRRPRPAKAWVECKLGKRDKNSMCIAENQDHVILKGGKNLSSLLDPLGCMLIVEW